jgi:hypothetical protein
VSGGIFGRRRFGARYEKRALSVVTEHLRGSTVLEKLKHTANCATRNPNVAEFLVDAHD